jgi:hypothetical protein
MIKGHVAEYAEYVYILYGSDPMEGHDVDGVR